MDELQQKIDDVKAVIASAEELIEVAKGSIVEGKNKLKKLEKLQEQYLEVMTNV